MRGNGSSGHRNDNGNSKPEEAILGKLGTIVTSPKPLLLVYTWHAVLISNPTTSIFSTVDEVLCANLQDYRNQEEFHLTKFRGSRTLCVWLVATVHIALVRAV